MRVSEEVEIRCGEDQDRLKLLSGVDLPLLHERLVERASATVFWDSRRTARKQVSRRHSESGRKDGSSKHWTKSTQRRSLRNNVGDI
jgi:hypothetical protein